ncbi:MAG: L,D-transpeptidase family protein [Actinobacteria bacterium]|uniref:Unannotated protein n=1 Tax=freshwater metagenome TaxID=449393 RepID=A0A6J6P4F8_9ZZZZ|nr:L,D-transpeptidase family protein [Actinomycetota bacterium]
MLLARRLVLALAAVLLLTASAYAVGRSTDVAHPDPATPSPVAAPAGPATYAPTQPPAAPTTRPSPVGPTAGPALLSAGDEGGDVAELQARLAQIDWFQADVTGYYGDVTTEAVRGFQAKREIAVTGAVDRTTMDRLLAMTTEPTPAELDNRANTAGPLDPRCTTGRVLCIDKTSSTLRWVVDGAVVRTLDARFGASTTPTREGVFSVYVKSRDHVSRLYGSAMPYAMFFSGGQAVHYSSDFAAVGYAGASHGCVNIRDEAGVAWLFDQVQVGDRVVVYRS